LMQKTAGELSGTVHAYHNDRLGTPELLTTKIGNDETVVWEAWYEPFGEAHVHPSSSVVNNIRLPGQYYDAETGNHYNGARYYDPRTGRYLTPDPIGLDGGINLFSYVENNPIGEIDTEGLRQDWYGPSQWGPLYHPGFGGAGIGSSGGFRSRSAGRSSRSGSGSSSCEATPPASEPVGRRSTLGGEGGQTPQHINPPYQPVQNMPGTIMGREYSGHALDQMRNRGVVPTAVENAIKTGASSPGQTPGTTVFHDAVNNVRVITNQAGKVVTVE
jgi:RHS repeat-associated protein